MGFRSDSCLKIWERPAVRLFSIFLILGIFAWWTFRVVSLPPTLRNLWNEDQAIAEAATPLEKEKNWRVDLTKLPAPPEEHAPEVSALLLRLQRLPPIPYALQTALQRNASTPEGQPFPPWSGEEKQALRESLAIFYKAWQPFLSGAVPDWKSFPDSILLFRGQNQPVWKSILAYEKLLDVDTGNPDQRTSAQSFGFYLSYFRQTRNLGAIRFGWDLSDWSMSETISTSMQTAKALQSAAFDGEYSVEDLQGFRAVLAPAPSLEDLRSSLDADRSLYLRTADYLAALPAGTEAKPALRRWLGNDSDTSWYFTRAAEPATAADLAKWLRRDAEQLELLRQKTYLAGPAWRHWLSGEPGAGLSPTLAQGLGGFRDFERVRMEYLITQGALEARIALEEGGLPAARRIPDPARPGSFLTIEKSPEGLRVSSRYVPPGGTNSLSFIFPVRDDEN